MKQHLAFSAFAAGLYFLVTLALLGVVEAGVQVEGFLSAIEDGLLFRSLLIDFTVIGAAAGALASIVFRKSLNQKWYTLITLILVLAFLEFVMVTVLTVNP